MTKTIVTGLLALVACTLMACGSAGGPSESDPTSAATTTTSEHSASPYYLCSHSRFPCSEQELQEVMSSSTYNKKTGHFMSQDLGDCQVCSDSMPCNWD